MSTKITKILKNQLDFIEEFSEGARTEKDIWLCAEDEDDKIECEGESEKFFNLNVGSEEKENIEGGDESKQSLVNLQKCMKELNILKEKDL